MTNIWAQSFEEVRKPFFEIEDPYTTLDEAKKKGDGNLANNYPPYDKVTRGDVIAGALGQDQMGGKKKKTAKEEYSPKVKKNEKIDGKVGAVNNKINTSPTTSESFEIDEASDTPPVGDAQTETQTLDAAKAKAARAKVAKELADLKLAQQAQRTRVTTNESVILYLENRYAK